MTRFVIIVLATAMLQAAPSVAGDTTNSGKKPSSYVPHSNRNHHVYGAPIAPPIVGHAKTAHHKHAPKKPPADR